MKRPVILDLSRLVWRVRHPTPSGIDRVERAYARHFLDGGGRRARFIARIGALGAREIPPAALAGFLASLEGEWRSGGAGHGAAALGRIGLRSQPAPAPGRAITIIPSHQNWHRRDWLIRRRGPDGRLVLFLHDTIPCDYPEYARAGGAQQHQRRLDNALATADAFIVNSAATAAALDRFAGGPAPSRIAPIGLDPLPPPAPVPIPAHPYFITVGTIEPRKNHLLLLHLWRRLADEMGAAAPRLVVAGRRGWENENIIDLLERGRGLAGLVIERNDLADDALSALVRGARALLMPSFAEGFGMPVIEALAAGTPVIAADLGVYRESAGEVPLYLDPLDGPGWIGAVRDYAAAGSSGRAAQLARMAGWTAPGWDAHFAAVDRLLEQLD